MRLVALVLTVIAFGAGLGLVSIGTVLAHAGDGGGVVEVLQSFPSCPATRAVVAAATDQSCADLRP
ncbi:MAG TPA: hypothetical protein VFP86_12875 [bacterium]|nr:hypothetical protein [bacterium]